MDDYISNCFCCFSCTAAVATAASTAATAVFSSSNSLLRIKLIKGPPKSKVAPIPVGKAI